MNLQLPQPLFEGLLPSLTLQFTLVPEGGNTSLALVSLHIQLVEGVHVAAWQPTRLCSMTLTSGFIGLPKAAVYTYQARLTSVEGVLSLIPFGDHGDRLPSLPLFHVLGQRTMWHWSYAGAQMTMRDKQPLEQMLAGCTHVSLVPTQPQHLLANHSSVPLKTVLLGDVAIPVELTEQACKQGIWCFYGHDLTEFTSTVCTKEANGLADIDSPLPGREMKTVNDEV